MSFWDKISDWFKKTFQPGTNSDTARQMAEQGGSPDSATYYGGTSKPHTWWDDYTGKTNTDLTNSATAALQEDAQAHQYGMAVMDYQWKEQQAEIERQRADTAIQRQVADLQSAGLNPWLAAGGSGAGSPGIANSTIPSSSANSAVNATKAGADIVHNATQAAMSAALVIKMLGKLY